MESKATWLALRTRGIEGYLLARLEAPALLEFGREILMAGRRSSCPEYVDGSDGMTRRVDDLRQKEKDLLKKLHRVEQRERTSRTEMERDLRREGT